MESRFSLHLRKGASLRWRFVSVLALSFLLSVSLLGQGAPRRAWGEEVEGARWAVGDDGGADWASEDGEGSGEGDDGDGEGDGAIWDDAPEARTPEERLAYLGSLAESGNVSIHVMAFMNNDAILLESDGRFGLVDAAEDNDCPDGSDPRYPLREGTIQGEGHEDELIAYMRQC